MKYIEALNLTKQARQVTPKGEEAVPEKTNFDPEGVLRNELTKHYATLLAAAMKRAGAPASFVRKADQFVSPVYSFALGRAADIHPDLLARLNPEDQAQFKGWNFHAKNITPGLLRDAVKAYDYSNREYVPLNQADEWAKGPKLSLVGDDK